MKPVAPNRVIVVEITEQAFRELSTSVRVRNVMGSLHVFSVIDRFVDAFGLAVHEGKERVLIESLAPGLIGTKAEKPKKPKKRKRG